MPGMLALVRRSRNPSGTVPRSSPTTTHWRATALERDVPEEVVERIGEIGPVGRRGALGDKKQALEAHRVVDAQHARVAHVGGVERAEVAPARARRRADSAPAGSSSAPGSRTDRAARRGRAARRARRHAPTLRRRPGPRRPRDPGRSRWRVRGRAPLCAARPSCRSATHWQKRAKSKPARSLSIAAAIAAGSPSRRPCGQRRHVSPASPAAIAWKAPKRLSLSPPVGDEGAVFGDEPVVRPRRSDAGEAPCSAREPPA